MPDPNTDAAADAIPDHCPLFPKYPTKTAGWIEARRVVVDGDETGHRTIAKRFPAHIDEVGLAEELGGGKFKLVLKKRDRSPLTDREFTVDGDEREWKRAPTEGASSSAGKPGELLSGVAAIIAAVGGGNRAECTRCAGMILQMQAATSGANDARAAANREMEDMRRRHNDEVDRLRARVKDLEEKMRERDVENIGLVRQVAATAGGTSQWVKDLKEAGPSIRPLVGELRQMWKGLGSGNGGGNGAGNGARQLPEITLGKPG